jgi:hypothetical protein
LIRTAGFFLHPVELLFQPVGFLLYGVLLAQRDLGLLTNP